MKKLVLFACIFLLFASNNSCKKEPTIKLSEIITNSPTLSSATSVISGGNITNDGGSPVTARGVCWGKSHNPTLSDSKTIDGAGTGSFNSTISGLDILTPYYFRAYATNEMGTSYGNETTLTTPEPSTNSDFKPTGAVPATESELLNIPTVESIDESQIPSLKKGTIVPSSFNINVPSPGDQGTQNCCVGFALGYGLLGHLFNYFEGHDDYNGTDKNFSPNFIWNQLNNGKNVGISYPAALKFVKSYGCCKLNDMPFGASVTDKPSPIAITNALNYKLSEYYRFNTINIDKIKYFISLENPVMVSLKVDNGLKEGTFEIKDGNSVWTHFTDKSSIENHAVLLCGYDDKINAFRVLNSWGTKKKNGDKWGDNGYFWIDYDFFKSAVVSLSSILPEIYVGFVKRPQITTKTITEITGNSAKSGGIISSDNGYAVTSRGICWSTNSDPTIADSKSTETTGSDVSFTSSINGLLPNTTYFVKAFASNSQGITYGFQKQFVTTSTIAAPVADFSASATSATVGQSIQFTDKSTNNPTSWLWNFGDGSTGTSQNPAHAYSAAGIYTVSLKATNSFGNNTKTNTNYITVTVTGSAPVADFTASTTSAPAGQAIQFTDKSTNSPTSWLWDFGDGSTSTSQQNPSHAYATAGTYTVSLKATNSYGNNTKTNANYITITVAGSAPVADFSASTTSAPAGQSIQFTDKSTNNPTSWLWDFGDGTTSSQQNPSHAYATAGTYTVSLKATNNYGSNTKNINITVNEQSEIKYGEMVYDGRTYKTIIINGKEWMAENLAYLPAVYPPSSGSYTEPRYYVYGYNGSDVATAKQQANYATYGVLYNWPAAKAACPPGWHLPSDDEWTTLSDYLTNNGYGFEGSGNDIAKALASSTGWSSYSEAGTPGNDPGSNNSSYFSALPGGRYYNLYGYRFINASLFGFWWSSTADSESSAWSRNLRYDSTWLYRNGSVSSGRDTGFSVRCVRD